MGTPAPLPPARPRDPEWVVRSMLFATEALLKSRSHVPFFATHPNGKACVILPIVGREKLRIQLLYDLHNEGLRATFCLTDFEKIRANWRKYCRAYVDFRIDPLKSNYPVAIDCEGTVRAQRELAKTPMIYPPTKQQIDAALGTKLSGVNLRDSILKELTK